jgi:hypothetical protein
MSRNIKGETMNEIFTDDQLNIGKVLVIGSGHNLKLSQIKELIRASKVRKIMWSGNYDDIDTFILSTMYKAISALEIGELTGADVYRVEGDDVVLTMLAMKTGGRCKSINLDAKNVKKLHNACLTKQSIDRAKSSMSNAVEIHNDLSVLLTKQKMKNGVTKKTNALDKVVQGYADAELAETLEKIKDVMSKTW